MLKNKIATTFINKLHNFGTTQARAKILVSFSRFRGSMISINLFMRQWVYHKCQVHDLLQTRENIIKNLGVVGHFSNHINQYPLIVWSSITTSDC